MPANLKAKFAFSINWKIRSASIAHQNVCIVAISSSVTIISNLEMISERYVVTLFELYFIPTQSPKHRKFELGYFFCSSRMNDVVRRR